MISAGVQDHVHRLAEAPGSRAAFCSQLKFSLVPNQLAIVAGNSIRLEAKIGGITPDMLSLNGRCVLWSA